MAKPYIIADLRGGRNGSDPSWSLPETQCQEAWNVDWWEGTLAHRRLGCESVSLTFSSGGPFAAGVASPIRHVPSTDETAAELWLFDGSLQIGRLAGAATWVEVTAIDAPSSVTSVLNVVGVSLGGFLHLAYLSAQNRMHVWDASDSSVRRSGLATPAAPTSATLGGSGITDTRFHRVRWVDVDGTDTKRRSEPSASVSLALTDDSGWRITQPTVAGEGETHWEVESADADEGPWYVTAQIAIATTTYDDTAATIDDSELSPEDGTYTPLAAFKYIAKAGARLLCAGAWLTSGGHMQPLDHEVWWTPVLGANDVGDLERMPPDYRVSLDHVVVGLSEPVNGISYAFGPREYSALVPTSLPGNGAFQRITETGAVGCLRHQAIVKAVDEQGRAAVYFLSQNATPYRIGANGLQYCGNDVEDICARVNLDAFVTAHGIYHDDKHQIWWYLALDDATQPSHKIVFDTRLGRFIQTAEDTSVRYGWAVHEGLSTNVAGSVMFSETIGASMSTRLVPYVVSSLTTALYRCETGTDDAGTDYEAYIITKEYAPSGLGRNCSLTEPHILAAASQTGLVTVTAITDFGRRTENSHLISLAPDQSETQVQKKVEGLQTTGISTVRFRIGDDGDSDPGFDTIDAFVMMHEDTGGPR